MRFYQSASLHVKTWKQFSQLQQWHVSTTAYWLIQACHHSTTGQSRGWWGYCLVAKYQLLLFLCLLTDYSCLDRNGMCDGDIKFLHVANLRVWGYLSFWSTCTIKTW